MKKLSRLFVGLLVPAFVFAGLAASPAIAQDKAKDTKAAPAAKAEKGKATVVDYVDNDKVRVFQITFKPGDGGIIGTTLRPNRVIRAIKGGTLTRTYADGTTDKVEFKTGEVRYIEADSKPFALKNAGKSEIVLYAVYLKEPKK
jgi:hypothetical protein